MTTLPIRDLTLIACAATVGVLAGFALGRSSERIGDSQDDNRTKEILQKLRLAHDRLEIRLAELDDAVTIEHKLAVERKMLEDRRGSLECLHRKRNLRKEMVRIQGMITTIFQNIVRLETKETQDQVAITMGEGELARILQLEDIEGDIVDYRATNNLSLTARPFTEQAKNKRVLNRSFSLC